MYRTTLWAPQKNACPYVDVMAWASYDTEIKLKTEEKGEFKKQTNCFLKNKKHRPCPQSGLTNREKKKNTYQLSSLSNKIRLTSCYNEKKIIYQAINDLNCKSSPQSIVSSYFTQMVRRKNQF